MNKKIMLAAIAKDEAAYLPEWIAYHLALGVDHIRVFVNKLEDNTQRVLEKISKVAPVSIFNADVYWDASRELPIDKVTKASFLAKNHFQARSISRMYRMATLEGYDYLSSIDVDEFIYLGNRSLAQFLDNVDDYRAARLQWFNVSGEAAEFDAPVRRKLVGDWAPLHKLVIPTGMGEKLFESPHDFARFNNEGCLTFSEVDDPCCIIHRYHRSEMEYLSMLGRGDVLHTNYGVKSNRVGFDTNPRSELKVSSKLIDKYQSTLEQLITEADLVDELVEAREFVRLRAKNVEQRFMKIPAEEIARARMFDGTQLKPGSKVTKFWN